MENIKSADTDLVKNILPALVKHGVLEFVKLAKTQTDCAKNNSQLDRDVTTKWGDFEQVIRLLLTMDT